RRIELAKAARERQQIVVADRLIAEQQGAVPVPRLLDLCKLTVTQFCQIDAGDFGTDSRVERSDRHHLSLLGLKERNFQKRSPRGAFVLAAAVTKQSAALVRRHSCG